MNVIIRQESIKDYEKTEKVVKNAFAKGESSDQTEHLLVSRLRKSSAFIPELSLVATDKENNKILGHILLTKINIKKENNESLSSLALAPVSVLPDYQNKGIGSLLITDALAKAKNLGFHSVIVLGHPNYYPKFGFQRASKWGIKAPFEVSDEVFMAIELREDALQQADGIVEYPGEFFM